MESQALVRIQSDSGIVAARKKGRELAAQLGFGSTEQALVATAISELARNILVYAKQGEIELSIVGEGGIRGLVVVARDEGPGIPDVNRALEIGYSTSNSLGLGLPGVRRLMDEFEVHSEVGRGTTVTVRKWRR